MHFITILTTAISAAGLASAAPVEAVNREEEQNLFGRVVIPLPSTTTTSSSLLMPAILHKPTPPAPSLSTRPPATATHSNNKTPVSNAKSTTTTDTSSTFLAEISTTTLTATTSLAISFTSSTGTTPGTTGLTTTSSSTTASTTTTTAAGLATGNIRAVFTSAPQAACTQSLTPGVTPDFNVIPTSCGISWLDTFNMFRRAYGLGTLTWSGRLASVGYGAAYNASGGAKPFVHSDLGYWQSSAEVESPGYNVPPSGSNLEGITPFGAAIVNWLCESPNDPQLQASGFSGIALCPDIQQNTDFISEAPGETGHHDIVVTPGYTQVGCGFVYNTQTPTGPFAGLYVCDFV